MLVLFECSSRQNSPSPSFSRRARTTSSAAIFSETNSTRLSLASACAIRFVIVCDLPVPGGPSSTKLRPSDAAHTAASCDESAGSGHHVSPGACAASSSAAAGKRASGS
ncbi:MAG: hypothetical protein H6828_09220 [Planctomycetes bacterium]|nr:hypothetical protein [Planctomycetota bacterium]